MEALLSISEYVVYPSLIYMALYLFIFVMWLFATDFYDAIEDIIGEGNAFFTTMFVISVLNYIVGKFLWSWANPINYLFNGILCIILLIIIGIFFAVFCESFNQYCRQKRGKD